ncbi:La [Choanephora cucurbitarum]|uniref:La n=1 Tax=Choanephora cucurbitarum TaxID=101091 RepID=A0A1C7N5Q8_9FUNG|nr:La [Choanephora cucurbitarum]
MAATNEQKICKQVEFYFSDSNLPYDKFLWTLRANAVEGWIPIETIASFKKMKMITEDFDTVVKALKEHESEIYEIDAEGKNIRRKSEVVQQDHVSRSIYVSGLPLVDVDAQDPVAELFKLQDKVEDLFGEHGKVLCVRFKKHDERPKKFKGSAYIEFESPEVAQKVAELKEVEFDGNKLEIMYKPKYHEMKSEQYKGAPGKKNKYSFNAFKAQQSENPNKRKNNGGFNKSPKKTKTEEKKEEEKPFAEEEKPVDAVAEEKKEE